MTDDKRKALVENGLKMAQLAHDGGCDTHGLAIELFTKQVERDGDCIEAQAAEIEKLREEVEKWVFYTKQTMLMYKDIQLEERAKIVAWLRNNPEVYDWSPPTIAAAIIDEEHFDDRYQQGD